MPTAAIAAHFEALSPSSLYLRFFSPRRRLSRSQLEALTTPDPHRITLVAILAGERQRIVGVGQYVVVRAAGDDSPRADLALSVADELHGRGLGTLLFERLLARARAAGIDCFTADVLGDNHQALRLIKGSGLALRRSVEQGVVHMAFSGPEVDRLVLVGELAAWAAPGTAAH